MFPPVGWKQQYKAAVPEKNSAFGSASSATHSSFSAGVHPNRFFLKALPISAAWRIQRLIKEEKEEEEAMINDNTSNEFSDEGSCATDMTSLGMNDQVRSIKHVPAKASQSRHMSLTESDDALASCQNLRDNSSLKNFIRCTSAQSSMSLSPVPHPFSFSNYSAPLIPSSATSRSVGEQQVPVDTRHIQVYLRKRDSRTEFSIKPPMSHQQSEGAEAKHMDGTLQNFRSPTSSAKKTRQASFKSGSNIFSVSSSVDSTKEEKIVTNLEHSPTANSTVMVIPKPHPPTSKKAYLSANRAYSVDQRHSSPRESLMGNTLPAPTPFESIGGMWHSVSDLAAAHSGNSPPPDAGDPSSPPRSHSQCAIRRKSHYLGEIVWQVDETVFCGGIESVQNQNLLCRLNIEYIVDLSGQDDDPNLKTRPRTECPCLCAKRTAHSRMTMAIKIKDESELSLRPTTNDGYSKAASPSASAQLKEREEVIRYFEVLIDLIRKARIAQKKVLIHSLKGRNRAPAFVAAYLMHCNRCTRFQAMTKISKMMAKMTSTRPGLCISDDLQRALMRWQSILGIRSEDKLDSNSITKAFTVKRNAWS